MPFHAMIFLGPSQVEPGSEQFVVYHTGPSGEDTGRNPPAVGCATHELSRRALAPVAVESRLLGVYRWNILRGAE